MAHHAQEATLVSITETFIDGHGHEHSLQDSDIGDNETHSAPASCLGTPLFPGQTPLPSAPLGTLGSSRCPFPAIPPENNSGRTLVLCFDGTGDQFDADNSNIVQLFSMLQKDDSTKQMVYYQSGIGTYTSPQIATPLGSKISQALDAMIAWNLDAHVMDGYEFLMQNYTANDRICIFGFSRGAYTARALAGMIHKVGLLPSCNFQQVPFAYKMYRRADEVGWEQSNAFKRAFPNDVPIQFIGVWDTVDSVGITPKRLPFTTSNTIVRTFRHAVSLDERRAKFRNNLWNRSTSKERVTGGPPESQPLSPPRKNVPLPPTKPLATSHSSGYSVIKEMDYSRHSDDFEERVSQLRGRRRRRSSPPGPLEWAAGDEVDLKRLESVHSAHADGPTDVEEVWFAGCHSDIGGGSVSNTTRHSLARISLRWMIRECFKANTGIRFQSERLKEIGMDPNMLYPHVAPREEPRPVSGSHIQSIPKVKPKDSMINKTFRQTLGLITSKFHQKHKPGPQEKKGSMPAPLQEQPALPSGAEEDEELMDAMSPMYDQLKLKWYWWILELVPMEFRYQKGSNQWVSWFGFNLARPRFIPEQHSNGVKVHRSVKLRMDAQHANGKKYVPKAHFHVDPTWVD